MMRISELHREPFRAKYKGEIRDGVNYVRSAPVLWVTFIMLAIIGVLSYNFTVTLPLFVTRSLHGSYGSFTLIYSLVGFGSLVGALLVANRRLVKITHVIGGAAALGVTMLVLSQVRSVALALPIAFALGLASIIYMTSTTAIVQIETVASMRGRILALQTILLIGTTPVGGPILGWLADAAGARLPLVIGGIACLVAGAFGYIMYSHTEHLSEA
jgi:MFS family permease